MNIPLCSDEVFYSRSTPDCLACNSFDKKYDSCRLSKGCKFMFKYVVRYFPDPLKVEVREYFVKGEKTKAHRFAKAHKGKLEELIE